MSMCGVCVCVSPPDNTPYLCRHTQPLRLILPVILCVTPLDRAWIVCDLNTTLTTAVCFCARTQARHMRCAYFSKPSQVLSSDVSIHLSSQLEVTVSSSWKAVWGLNWQADLHYFDYSFFCFWGTVCLFSSLIVWVMFNKRVFCFPFFLECCW